MVKICCILASDACRDFMFVSIIRFSDTRNPVVTMKFVYHKQAAILDYKMRVIRPGMGVKGSGIGLRGPGMGLRGSGI